MAEILCLLCVLATNLGAQDTKPAATKTSGLVPTHADVKYGPHERNVMDVWLAESAEPTPIAVFIHGGSFQVGDKTKAGGVGLGFLGACLKSKISVASINYRLTQDAMAPASFVDAARAVQFIRHQAKAWNIDTRRVAASGGSAGAGIALWLGLHDDLADPKSSDPVLRESTRLSSMAVTVGQTSYDPRFIKQLFPENDTYKTNFLAALFRVDLNKLDGLPAEKYRLFEEISPITHASKDDPPVLMIYGVDLDTPITNQSVGIHHPRFGKALKDKLDEAGVPCELRFTLQGHDSATAAFIKQQFDASK